MDVTFTPRSRKCFIQLVVRPLWKRKDNSRRAREDLFERLVSILPADVHFETDGHEHYKTLIKHYFPDATHRVFPSVRGAIVGLGELKKTRFDPLFTINHFLATMRAKVNRLVRRTWCTTKDPDRLSESATDEIMFSQLKPTAALLSSTLKRTMKT